MINKLLKEIIRYTKEENKYIEFKNEIKTKSITIYHMLKVYPPLSILTALNIEPGDSYVSPFIMHYHKKYKKENIQLFEKFLKENYIKKQFVNNIDENFWNNSSYKKYFELEINIKDKLQKLYNIIPFTAFVMCAFEWDNTEQGFDMWENINRRWVEYLNDFIKKKYNINQNEQPN